MPAPLTMDEAAAELSVSRRWLQAFLNKIPPCHMAAGHRKLFDEAAMATIRAAMRQDAAQREAKRKCRSSSSRPRRVARNTGASAEPNSASILIEALRQSRSGRPRDSSRSGAPTPKVVPFPVQDRKSVV